ncbi:MAG: Rid family detoxifying hydrolase [Candidatus Hodarchaeales archaeon]|jgi:2-iminobutanoate/2-iminopropanoate deaminase
MNRKRIISNDAPNAVGPYSQAIESNGLIFCSGQIAIDPKTGQVLNEASIEEQTHRVMKNLQAVLNAAGVNFKHVVKSTVYCTDLSKFSKLNEIYGSYFEGFDPPARATVQVAALPLNTAVQIEMIAVKE